jgi:hypothetical protein
MPEVVNGEAYAKNLTNLPCKPEQEGIDQQREQAQGQEDERTSQQLEQRAQEGIDQPEDKRQPYDGCPASLQGNTRNKSYSQEKCDRVDGPTQNEFGHFVLLSITLVYAVRENVPKIGGASGARAPYFRASPIQLYNSNK